MDEHYQWEALKNNLDKKRNISNWFSKFGSKVIKKNKEGFAQNVKFSVLNENKKYRIYIVGNFNNWGKKNLDNYLLIQEGNIASIELENVIKHKDEYLFLIENEGSMFFIQDPASSYFSHNGNSIFWDFEDPTSYIQKYEMPDTFKRSIKILQTDLYGLVVHYANKQNICGKDIKKDDIYRFIADSGVIREIKDLGFNTVQFLPFAQSIDGDNWKYRYLVPFHFAVQKNYGNPDDFAYMIDMFHKEGISIIGDFVVGHLPDRNFSIFGQSSEDNGIHQWKKDDNSNLFMKDETSWGSRRLDFDNPFVREFFISSCLHYLKYYKIDGFRIDNVDGIIRYGDNGDGEERPNGRVFLRELAEKIYSYNPFAMLNYEAHYYYEDNAKMLVAPIKSDVRALGATAYNSSRLTYFFHSEYMFKAAEDISVWKIKEIDDEQRWGKSNSTIADFHNHDAAAGLMEQRCTGAFAYESMMQLSTANHIHAIGKIKVMEAIISFFCEGRTLDLLQTFLLQPGSFEHDSSIRWDLSYNQLNKNLVNFKKK
jgi:1,4-alpha-glucan branching enzyme